MSKFEDKLWWLKAHDFSAPYSRNWPKVTMLNQWVLKFESQIWEIQSYSSILIKLLIIRMNHSEWLYFSGKFGQIWLFMKRGKSLVGPARVFGGGRWGGSSLWWGRAAVLLQYLAFSAFCACWYLVTPGCSCPSYLDAVFP